jgi:hypothetical protein
MRISLSLILLFSSLASPVMAQTMAQRAACGADAKKYCAGTPLGGGKMLDCLAKQKDKISDACKKVVESQGK